MRPRTASLDFARYLAAAVAMGASLLLGGTSGAADRHLEEEFRKPPVDCRPSAYWPWIGGHITKEGIKADLEAMKSFGMRGGNLFELSLYIPVGDVRYGSPEWEELVDYALATGSDMGFHNCPRWATSVGPRVTPEDSMKRMVFSETTVNAAGAATLRLPMPSDLREDFYRDVAVLAIPQKIPARTAKVTFDGGDVSGQGTGQSGSTVPVRSGEPAVFVFDFGGQKLI